MYIQLYTDSSKSVKRHVHHADIGDDLVYYYCDGVSSLICDLGYHTILHCPASKVVGLITLQAWIPA